MYQTTMHVPLVFVGPGFKAGTNATPISTRRIFNTILGWAGLESTAPNETVIAAEAMKPFLDYGWQPQVMAVSGSQKAIMAGKLEVYDVVADPHEQHDLAAQANLSREIRATLRDYPLPSARGSEPPANLDEESQRKLASLGYVSSSARPVIRKD